uniref:RNase P modulator RnpM n=1 Tax=Ndongobacter massiliensis TaxID=1871025 RepID=UPI0009302FF4|nr:YlxR family protein [Ndongobacter massiliensis]
MNRRVPLRKCIACQARKPKRELVRIVCDPQAGIVIDPTGKAEGRGAYLCRDAQCIAKAQKRNLLRHALKASIDETIYEEIMDYVEQE